MSVEPAETERVHKNPDLWGEGVRLEILESPYRLLMQLPLEHIETIDRERQKREVITVVAPRKAVANLLHTQSATWLERACATDLAS